MPLPPFLTSIVNWLRAGYPDGVPSSDYIPLVALLARRLTADEVRRVSDELIASGTLPAGNADIGVPITKITDELPREEDLLRVRARLTMAGWPLTD